MRRDPGLVVGRAPAVEAIAADGGLERRAVPVGRVVLRLDIVVRVEQDDRSALGSLPLADHGRRGAVAGPDDLGLDAFGRQELGRLPRGLLYLFPAPRVGADGLDPDEGLEIAEQGGQEIMDTVLQVAHGLNPTTAIMGLADDGGGYMPELPEVESARAVIERQRAPAAHR